jgi:hypothetical protein
MMMKEMSGKKCPVLLDEGTKGLLDVFKQRNEVEIRVSLKKVGGWLTYDDTIVFLLNRRKADDE